MEKQNLELEITELRLGIPGVTGKTNEKKRVYSEVSEDSNIEVADLKNNPAKTQVVGWPPVCSYRRKNSLSEKKTSKMYVKVSMDGAPFLRKIDLGMHKGYNDLATALEKLIASFGIGGCLKNEESRDEYVPIYEDKDGDWMLAGDVPWEMFTESCKRLRIMKKSEVKGFGLQPKSVLGKTENS